MNRGIVERAPEAGELGGAAGGGQAVQVRVRDDQVYSWPSVSLGAMVHGLAQNPPIPGASGQSPTMTTFRRFAFALSPLALAIAWLAFAGPAAAQSQAATAQQSSEEAAKAEAEKRSQAEAEAARKAEARKPKRDKSKDDKGPERELEEEEDI